MVENRLFCGGTDVFAPLPIFETILVLRLAVEETKSDRQSSVLVMFNIELTWHRISTEVLS